MGQREWRATGADINGLVAEGADLLGREEDGRRTHRGIQRDVRRTGSLATMERAGFDG